MKKIFVCFVLAVLDMFCFAQNYKNDFERITNENTNILDNLKNLGFKKRKELVILFF